MSDKTLDDLKPNAMNPRSMSAHDAKSLENGLHKFGDLGGIIFNVALNRLVGGHMRVKTFEKMGGEKSVVITQRFDPALPTGTTALGYIKYNNEYYAYREVSWNSEAHDMAANVLANRAGGDFVLEKLADVNELIRQQDAELLAVTGQTDDEIAKLNQLGNEPEQPANDDTDNMTFKFMPDQAEIVNEALGYVLAKHNVTNGNMDIRANAITYICKEFLNKLHDEQEQPESAANLA